MILIYLAVNQNELYHYGVPGMRWGVRRYQNRDGTRTAEGKRHAKTGEASTADKIKAYAREHKTGLKRAAIIGAGVGTAVALHYIAKNKAKDRTIGSYAREGAKQIIRGTKDGVKSGLSEGPKKATAALIVGGTLLGTKKIADLYVGKDVAGQMFNANNSKKIGSFWNYKEGGKDDDD